MKQQKTILFITGKIIYGGAGKMMNYVAGLCAQEFEHVYAVAMDSEEVCTEQNGINYLPSLNVHKRGLINWLKTIIAVRRKIKEIRPDIVVSFVSDTALVTRLSTLCMRGVIVVGAERGDPFTLSRTWQILSGWAYRHSDYCFFQLEKARDFYGKRVAQKSFVIPNAAFFNGEIGCHREMNKTIVTAGRFALQKGFCYLIDAFKIVHDKYPDYKLVIYGDGALRHDYELQINLLGLNNVVSLPGYTHNVAEAFRYEGIFVLSSLFEGIPNALIEAMLTGIPTVSADCTPGGPDFLTNHGERGLLVPMKDSVALAKAICRLVEDKELYCNLEKEGPKIIDILNPRIIDTQWIKAFNTIANHK